jgi:hypothetical protein
MPSPTPDQLTAIVAAMLTVNQYPVARAWGLMPAFREAGLLDPARVDAMTWDELKDAMIAAGYDRGGFVPIVGARLAELMRAQLDGRLDPLGEALASGDAARATAALCAIKGFGPRVAEVALALMAA